jgi:hypothetical protein
MGQFQMYLIVIILLGVLIVVGIGKRNGQK